MSRQEEKQAELKGGGGHEGLGLIQGGVFLPYTRPTASLQLTKDQFSPGKHRHAQTLWARAVTPPLLAYFEAAQVRPALHHRF